MSVPEEFDVVILGSGAAGLSAAFTAAQAGLKVLVLEKAATFGGTTAISRGAIWIPGNDMMAAQGTPDTREEAETYLRAVMGNFYDAELIAAFLDNGPAALRFLTEKAGLKFVSVGYPDYESELRGARPSRSLVPEDYDGRLLGPELATLRKPLPQTTLNGIHLGFRDFRAVLRPFASFANFRRVSYIAFRHAVDKLRHGRSARLAGGNALAARLLKAVNDAGVTLWSESPARSLVMDRNRVTGVTFERGGKQLTVNAAKGVILATGGFGGNRQMRSKYMPFADAGWSLQPEENAGDGIGMGCAAGAILETANEANAIWTPMSAYQDSHGKLTVFPHFLVDRFYPGTIVVDGHGKRFVNEATTYQNFVNQMHLGEISTAYLICDHSTLRRSGLGMARSAPFSTRRLERLGYLKKGATLQDLAGQLGIDGTTLLETVKRFNDHAELGLDPQFHRGEDAYTRFMGDPKHQPNPTLGPLVDGPFYAVELHPGDISSFCGLRVNQNAQVVDHTGSPILGLYAAGLDMNTIFRGTYPGGGASIGPALTFGYIAARHLARHTPCDAP